MRKIRSESRQLLNKKKKILIFGKNSTLAKDLLKILNKKYYDIELIGKKDIIFLSSNLEKKIEFFIKKHNPDIILNFIGKFQLNEKADKDILLLNLYANWLIIKYFLKNKVLKKTSLIFLGSSSASSPRKNYMLYTASKTGLNNLVKSSNDYFKNTTISVKIFNPKTFGGKHLKKFRKKTDIESIQVAKKIYRYIKKL